jgi:hypothetical protein
LIVPLLVGTALVSEVSAAEKLTRTEAESTIARLSDKEVRELLIRQISKADAAQGEDAESFNPAVIVNQFQLDVGRLSAELNAIYAAVGEFPGIFPEAWARFTSDREQGGLLWFVVAVGASMGVGGLLAVLIRLRVNRLAGGADAPSEYSTIAKCRNLGWRLAMHGLYIVGFAAASSAVFIAFFDDTERDRIAFFFYLAAAVILLSGIAVSIAVHSPQRPRLRLPLYSDVEAKALHRTVLATTGFGAFAYFTCTLFGTLGMTSSSLSSRKAQPRPTITDSSSQRSSCPSRASNS